MGFPQTEQKLVQHIAEEMKQHESNRAHVDNSSTKTLEKTQSTEEKQKVV